MSLFHQEAERRPEGTEEEPNPHEVEEEHHQQTLQGLVGPRPTEATVVDFEMSRGFQRYIFVMAPTSRANPQI